MKGKMIIAFFVAMFLLSIIPYDSINVSAVSNSYSEMVDNPPYLANQQLDGRHNIYSHTYCGNSFSTIASPFSGTHSFSLGAGTSGNRGNFTFGGTKLIDFSFVFYFVFGGFTTGTTTTYYLNFKNPLNATIGSWYITLQSFGNAQINGGTPIPHNTWYYSKISINSMNQLHIEVQDHHKTTYYTHTNITLSDWVTNLSTIVCTSSSIGQQRIDTMYIDNINFTLGDYSGGGGSGGCIDTSGIDYYSKNIEVFDSYLDISSPFIEFTSHSSLSLTPEVFELWVGSALYEGDSDTSNYFLYINGISCGNPICFYLLSGQTYVLQWDLSSISPISEEVLIFELAHSITFDGTHYWNIARATANLLYGPPSPTMITYKNTGTNGVLDGTPEYSGSCWKLYFSAFGTPEDEENTDFDVGINLIGFNTHPTYNTPYSFIYETIYFEVFSNRTDNYYHLNISKGAVTQGNEQGYPKDIYSYHVIHGYTPTTEGNYTVSLCRDSNNVIVDHKHFNITTKTVDYAIWTFPNPSNTGVNHGVTVYISDDTVFQNYYVSGVVDEDLVNNFNSSDRKIIVGTLDGNKYWSTSLITFAISGWEYWRLWGTNDNISFIPLTSPYLHYVNSLTQNNYIRTSLTNGEGYTGESFNVYGLHSYILSQVSVYLDNKPIKDVSTNVSFLIPYSFSNVGTHTFSLRVFNDGVWETVDSVVVSITIKPSGGGELGGMLPPPYSYIMGAIITIVLMILPSIALGKIGISGSESLKYVPIFSGTTGFILSCLIGFFPWYSIFALLFVLILIIVALYLAKSKQ